ncbi:MAG TPA: hypothetical protein PK771_09965, partial [Spirochaetota bacterium]|nr:hypothetical protein [Spirochaetota bacterium]
IIATDTGILIKQIGFDGNLNFGYKPVVFNNNLIIPLSSGVYKIDVKKYQISKFCDFQSSTTPLVLQNRIVFSSYLDGTIEVYDNNMDKFSSFRTTGRIFISPVQYKDNIILFDSNKVVYLIDSNGKLLSKNIVGENPKSELLIFDNKLYFETDKNDFVSYDLLTDKIIKIHKFSDIKEKFDRIKDAPFVIRGDILYKNNGKLLIYSIYENKVTFSDFNGEFISASIKFDNKLLSGTNDGKIIFSE